MFFRGARYGDKSKTERWNSYPHVKGTPIVNPVKHAHLSNRVFMDGHADVLSFDVSRFTEFLSGYNQVNEDLKPVMLHYSMIYLFDFFTRTWLKYRSNWGHGITPRPREKGSSVNEYPATIEKKGIFPRAVDAFYFLGESSLYSPDDDDGIGYTVAPSGGGRVIHAVFRGCFAWSSSHLG